MAASNFQIIGLLSLTETLTDAVVDGESDEVEKASRQLQDEIQSRAPVDTGRLRDSYEVEIEDRGGKIVGRVYSDVPYAVHQEYIYTPHVRPALESQRGAIMDQFGKTVKWE